MFKDCNNKKAMSLCKHRDSLLVPYTDTLLSFIFELRETGMSISTTMVLMKAAQVCHDFHEKKRGSSQHHKMVCQGSWDGAPNWYPFIPTSTRRDAGGGTGEMQGEALDFCSGLPFVMSFTLHFFLGEPGSAASNDPEMIAPMATPLFL